MTVLQPSVTLNFAYILQQLHLVVVNERQEMA